VKALRNYLNKIKPTFEEGGRLSMFRSVFEGFETFLFVPSDTSQSGVHIHDSIDSKRTMTVVVIALASLSSAASSIAFSAISGTGNTRHAFLLEMLALAVYTLYIYVAVVRLRLPVHLSFVSDIVYYVAITIGSIVYFRRAAWYQKDV